MNSYQTIINGFNPEIYTKILVYSKITPSVRNFTSNFYAQIEDLVSNFSSLQNLIVNYTAVDLVESDVLKNSISQLYDHLDDLLKMPCSTKEAILQQINSFRSQYSANLNDLGSASSVAISN